jgi:hypothetical protein
LAKVGSLKERSQSRNAEPRAEIISRECSHAAQRPATFFSRNDFCSKTPMLAAAAGTAPEKPLSTHFAIIAEASREAAPVRVPVRAPVRELQADLPEVAFQAMVPAQREAGPGPE